MRLLKQIVAVGLIIELCACAAPPVRRYSGTIERKEWVGMSGYVVSPRSASGYVTPYRLFVAVRPVSDAGADGPRASPPARQKTAAEVHSREDTRMIWIEFTDTRTRMGEVGDTIAFTISGELPVNDHVSFEALRDVMVTPRK